MPCIRQLTFNLVPAQLGSEPQKCAVLSTQRGPSIHFLTHSVSDLLSIYYVLAPVLNTGGTGVSKVDVYTELSF